MSFIDKHRQQMREQPRPPSGLGTILFGIGVVAAGIVGFLIAQTFWDRPGLAGITIDSAESKIQTAVSAQHAPSKGIGKRIGRAEVAPALRACSDKLVLLQATGKSGTEVDPGLAHLLLRFGNQPEDYVFGMGPFIECALDRNRPDVCDPDNRALVVEATGRFLSLDDEVAKKSADPEFLRELRKLPMNHTQLREQILLSVALHAREGRLIRSDFGWAPHADIRKVFDSAKSAPDPCPR